MTDVFEMREIGEAEWLAADDKLIAAKEPVTIADHFMHGPFDVFTVASGAKFYDVMRLGTFAKCPCPDFTFTHEACKHIAATEHAPKTILKAADFAIGDMFRITNKAYKREVWSVTGTSADAITIVDRREMKLGTNPDGWAEMRMTDRTLEHYSRNGEIERILI